MSGESIYSALEPLLERVSKPIQYVGGELNSTVKDWHVGGHGPDGQDLTVRWALMYPDAYEVGVPNQGVMILYEVLNERPDALAERTYSVWPDLEALMREPAAQHALHAADHDVPGDAGAGVDGPCQPGDLGAARLPRRLHRRPGGPLVHEGLPAREDDGGRDQHPGQREEDREPQTCHDHEQGRRDEPSDGQEHDFARHRHPALIPRTLAAAVARSVSSASIPPKRTRS